MKWFLSLFKKRESESVTISDAELSNDGLEPLQVWLEPWGHPLQGQSGTTINIQAVSPLPGSLEVVKENGIVAVYGWSRSSISVYESGELIEELFELPDLGNGPSPRKVVESLFGGPGGPRVK